ncbi:MAG: ATP-binding cassette domain-containing protein [Pseudomonadales bacterium]
MQTLITLNNIRTPKKGAQQFELPEWQLRAGEQWAVLGGNGAGKTLFANIVSGRQTLARGERNYAAGFSPSADILSVSFEQQRLLYEYDDRFDDSEVRADVFDKGTTAQQLILQGRESGALFNTWVERLGIANLLDRGIRFLSTGEMRKTLLAQALVSQPQVIILDNPLEGLDRQAQRQLSQLLTELLAESITFILLLKQAEHMPANISHVMLLADCRLVAQGSIDDVRHTEAFSALQKRLPTLPEQLPAVLAGQTSIELSPTTPLIEMRRVKVSYGDKQVLRDVNWTMRQEQHTSISGPNGSGKSTLLSLLSGDNPKAYGQDIYLFGNKRGSGESVWELKQKFGVVSTALQTAYVRGYKVLDVVVSGFHDSIGLYSNCGDAQAAIARQWLQLIDMEGQAAGSYQALSYGEQRMVLLARAMVKRPLILLLDEPCIGLDDYNRRLILQLVDYIASVSQTHIIYVSHVASEQPVCINQQLVFEDNGRGHYQLIEH